MTYYYFNVFTVFYLCKKTLSNSCLFVPDLDDINVFVVDDVVLVDVCIF